MSEKPSRFHTREYNSNSKWRLNLQHKDLISTAHVKLHYYLFCAYCGERCLEIQANYGWYLDKYPYCQGHDVPSNGYQTTGYTCDCVGARAEREKQDKISQIEEAAKQQILAIQKEFTKLHPYATEVLKEKAVELARKNFSFSIISHKDYK